VGFQVSDPDQVVLQVANVGLHTYMHYKNLLDLFLFKHSLHGATMRTVPDSYLQLAALLPSGVACSSSACVVCCLSIMPPGLGP